MTKIKNAGIANIRKKLSPKSKKFRINLIE